MEKLLICDFDDTVKTSSRYITSLNFKAIKRFRKQGNKLVFASGRDFNSLKYELTSYSCPYDALICNDGSTIFDFNNKIIFYDCFKENQIKDLLYYFDNYAKNLIYTYHFFDTHGYSKNSNDIVEIVIIPKLFKKTDHLIFELKDFFPYLHINKLNYRILIRKNLTKSEGVKIVSDFFDIENKNIYTIGDWKNDYEMIRDYNGYNVILSHPCLYNVSKGTVPTVSSLVKKLENK